MIEELDLSSLFSLTAPVTGARTLKKRQKVQLLNLVNMINERGPRSGN